jgi:uncharacterized circularly permuted ATP-grasp superfamily protein
VASELFDGYESQGAYDEMFVAEDAPRRAYEELFRGLGRMSAEVFAEKNALADAFYLTEGITFAHNGREQPFPFDLLPRLVSAAEWAQIEAGLAQRVRALDLFLGDIYGPRRCVSDGVIPNRLIVSCEGYSREMVGIEPPLGRFAHLAGIDLVRDVHGAWCVLEDNLRTPSGLSYVVQNRTFMRRVFPEAFSNHEVEPVDHAPLLLRGALAACAPRQESDPRIVVLTPGAANSAYYEHAFLAQQMGVALAEGRDMIVRDRQVYLKTTAGLDRVDVIYRRIDDAYLDPVSLRPDSLLGVPGLMGAYRAGNVTICNAPGT